MKIILEKDNGDIITIERNKNRLTISRTRLGSIVGIQYDEKRLAKIESDIETFVNNKIKKEGYQVKKMVG